MGMRELCRYAMVFRQQRDRIAAYLQEQSQCSTHLLGATTSLAREQVTDLIEGEAGDSHGEPTDRSPGQLAFGLGLEWSKPLRGDAGIDNPGAGVGD